MKSFDITGYHPRYTEDLQLAAAKVKERMTQLQVEGDYSNKLNDKEFIKLNYELQREEDIAKQGTSSLVKIEAFNRKNINNIVLNEEVNDAYQKGLRGDGWDDFKDLTGDIATQEQFASMKVVAPDWWSKAQKYAPSKAGTKIEEGKITITNKGANKEANKVRAENIYELAFTAEEQQEAINDAGSKEEAINRMANEMDLRVETFFGVSEDEPRAALKDWDINKSGWKNKKYVFKYSSEEKEVFGAKKLEETVFLEYLGTPDLSKLQLNIKGLPLEGRITSFKIDEKGKWSMQYKTSEEHPRIKATEGKGAVTISIPWEDIKTEVEGKYQFDFDAMLDEVRALQSGKPTGKKEIERLDPKTNKIAIFNPDTKEFIRWK